MNSAYDTFSTPTTTVSESVRRDLFNTSKGNKENCSKHFRVLEAVINSIFNFRICASNRKT